MALPAGFKIRAHQQCQYPECRGKQGVVVSVTPDVPQPDGTTADVYRINFPDLGDFEMTLGDFFPAPNDDLLKPS